MYGIYSILKYAVFTTAWSLLPSCTVMMNYYACVVGVVSSSNHMQGHVCSP